MELHNESSRPLNEPAAGDRVRGEPETVWGNESPPVAEQAVGRLVEGIEPATVREILESCLRGALSAQVALMQLVIATENVADVRAAVDEVTRRADEASRATDGIIRDRVDALTRLVVENEDGCGQIAEMLRSNMDTSAPAESVEEGIAHCERLFDWSVQQNEEASVALYSLGSPELLSRATAEIVDAFDAWGLLGPGRRVLQIGCGIGRIEAAIAGRVGEAHGIDVSTEMVNAARRRTADLPNVFIEKTSGRDLSLYGDAEFDLVFAVDTFPYLVQSGMPLVERHFAEAHRVLKPGAELVILNFSYRDSVEHDRADVRRLAAEHGFSIVLDGVMPFELWNGVGWRVRKERS
jgi:cyclopropane fatty-acyl-phospholipid synthase-like methyltransferase